MNARDGFRAGVIQRTVGSGGHVQAAAVLDDLLEHHPVAALRSQTHAPQLAQMVIAVEPVSFPIRDLIGRVEGHPRGADRRIHHRDGIDDTRFVFVTRGWPAVVGSLQDDVELVVVAGPILGSEQPMAQRVEVKAKRVAQSVRPDGGLLASLSNERVVIRNRAIRVHAQDLPGEGSQVLGVGALVVVCERDIQLPIWTEAQLARVVNGTGWQVAQDGRQVGPLLATSVKRTTSLGPFGPPLSWPSGTDV